MATSRRSKAKSTKSAKKKPAKKPTKKKPTKKKPAEKKPGSKAKKREQAPSELEEALAAKQSYLFLKGGEIPPEVRRLPWLKTLSVSGNVMTGCEAIEELVDLETLTLWGTLEAVPAALSRLQKLRELRITILKPDAAEPLGDLSSLETLHLRLGPYGKPVAFPRWLGRLKNLKSLSLNGDISDVPDEIAALAQLEELELGIEALPRLADGVVALKRLRKLEMKISTVDDRIGELGALESLSMSNTWGWPNVIPLAQLPPAIGRLAKLTELNLGSNLLTALPPEIGELVSLTCLRAYRNALTSLPPEIGKLKRLTRLELGVNPFRSLPPEIGDLESLEYLNLGEDQQCEAGLEVLPPQIGKLRSLQALWSPSGRLQGLPAEIGGCKALKRMYLSRNRITSVPAELGQLEQLEDLSLAENPITSLPSEIEGCTALKELDLTGCAFPQPAYDQLLAFRAARGNPHDFKLPRVDTKRPEPPTTASTARLAPDVLAALAARGLDIQSPAKVPPPKMRTMKGGARYPVPEAMRQFIEDVRWPKGVRYDVKFSVWEHHGLDFCVGANLDEYECTFHHFLDGVSDGSGDILVWNLVDPDPTNPALYRVGHGSWSDHHPLRLNARLSDLIKKMRPTK